MFISLTPQTVIHVHIAAVIEYIIATNVQLPNLATKGNVNIETTKLPPKAIVLADVTIFVLPCDDWVILADKDQ